MDAVGSFFLTWYPQRGTQAADFHPLNLGAKPYNPERIAQNKANRESRHCDCITPHSSRVTSPNGLRNHTNWLLIEVIS